MSRAYVPRRASARWLDGDCPDAVLFIFDAGPAVFDRYTVGYRPAAEHRGEWWVDLRGMSADPTHPQGFGVMDQMRAHEVRAYRRRAWRESCRWTDLPEAVRAVVRRDAAEYAKAAESDRT